MDTLYLTSTGALNPWDLCLDASGNIAKATNPYALAQDAASAIRTFIGECYYDTSLGVPYFQQILGKNPPLELVRAQFVKQALTVPEVVSAKVFFATYTNREITGQVQVTSTTGVTTVAGF